MIHSQYGIDLEDLQLLCKGKIQWRKCPDCDVNGLQYWDGKTGEGVNTSPSGIDPEWLERGGCETCLGLSYQLFYV